MARKRFRWTRARFYKARSLSRYFARHVYDLPSDPNRGQGRKPLAQGQASVPVCIRMTPEQRDKLAALGGPAWIRKKIDTAKVKT